MNDIIKAAIVLPALFTISVFVSGGMPHYSDGSEVMLAFAINVALAVVGVVVFLIVKTALLANKWRSKQLRR